MKKHLWEVDHEYYSSENNFYSNDCHFEYKNFEDYLSEMRDYDMDLNAIFRFDWRQEENEGIGELQIVFVLQRKGIYASHHIPVVKADEEKVIEYLSPQWKRMLAQWEPFGKETK